MGIWEWVGAVAAIWIAASVMVAVAWHRMKKAQPKFPTLFDGREDW